MSAAPWRLKYVGGARKDLRRLDPPVRERVVIALERLAQRPQDAGLVRLKGQSGARLRVGDWRVIIELDRGTQTIKVKRVLPRGRAYER